jgi:hypothetical protein
MIVLSELERIGLERRLTDLGLVHRYSLPLGITPPSQVPAAGRGIDVRLGDHVIERILRNRSSLLRGVLRPVMALSRIVRGVRMVR